MSGLRAVVSGAHRDTLPVEDLRHVVRVDAVDVQGHDPGAVLGRRAVRRNPRELVETAQGVLDEIALVPLDRGETDLEYVVDGGPEPDRLGDRGSSSLELVRQLVPGRSLHGDGPDHLAAEVERRHRLEELPSAPERADSARPAHLVRRDRQELAVERLHVERAVRRRLGGIHDHDRVALVRPVGEVLHRVHRPERVRHEIGGDHLHATIALDLVERVQPQLSGLVDRDRPERRARPPGDVLPRDEARVVLEIGDDDEVARAEVVETPGVRDEVQRLGGGAGEDHLALGRRVHVARNLASRGLVAGRRPLGEPVHPAMDVRIRVLVELA